MKGKRQDEQKMCIIRSHNSDCSKMEGERETKEIARRKGKQERNVVVTKLRGWEKNMKQWEKLGAIQKKET